VSAVIEEQDPIAVFMYALKAPESKRQYPRRFKVLLDYLRLEGDSLSEQAKKFLIIARQDPKWASMMRFITFQKERVEKGEISESTISNYYKATKLFCEMNCDTQLINWKKNSPWFVQREKSSY
jgi:hypothetical protein